MNFPLPPNNSCWEYSSLGDGVELGLAASQYKMRIYLTTLLVSPFISPILLPYIPPYTTPFIILNGCVQANASLPAKTVGYKPLATELLLRNLI